MTTLITDSQFAFETGYGPNLNYCGIIVGSGPVPDFDLMMKTCKIANRLIVGPTLLAYLAALPGTAILVKSTVLCPVVMQSPSLKLELSGTEVSPIVVASGVPTFAILLLRTDASVLTSTSSRARHVMCLTIGDVGTEADLHIKGQYLTKDQVFRMRDIEITLANVVC